MNVGFLNDYPPDELRNKELEEYFEKNNWEFTWDFNSRDAIYWYEILHNDKLVLQIETNVKLETLKEFLKEQNEKFDGNLESVLDKLLENKFCLGEDNGK